ncbi:tetratricopeptide repeat protein [Paracoccaceae bacterium]|nr:tetratricopeptide repeat protein [Paracoccaceae bacterium]
MNGAKLLAQKCLDHSPTAIKAKLLLATCFYGLNRVNDGLALVEEVIRQEPRCAEAVILGVQFLLQKNNDEFAFFDLKAAYHIKPFLTQIWDIISILSIKFSDYELCIEILDRVQKQHGLSVTQKMGLARCHFSLSNYSTACSLYEELSEISPQAPEVFQNLGVAYKQLRQVNKAHRSFGKALQLNPQYVNAHINLAAYEIELGQVDKAFGSYQCALDIDPNSLEGWQDLIEIKVQTASEIKDDHAKWLLNKFPKAPKLNILLAIHYFVNSQPQFVNKA